MTPYCTDTGLQYYLKVKKTKSAIFQKGTENYYITFILKKLRIVLPFIVNSTRLNQDSVAEMKTLEILFGLVGNL